MPENQNRKIMLPRTPGLLQDLATRLKLILRLLGDGRVNPLLKLLPVASAVYLLFPDLAPGPLDDAAIIWLSTYLFVELCPPDVVQEHIKALQGSIPSELRNIAQEEEIVEGEIVESDTPQGDEPGL
ncbi:MAG: hypothetical protein JW726_19395 [Anaerolineales bacterium]|nr:hypothetical protein [Anaerolineales bacterium]